MIFFKEGGFVVEWFPIYTDNCSAEASKKNKKNSTHFIYIAFAPADYPVELVI